MAVTQQLARVSSEYLSVCRQAVENPSAAHSSPSTWEPPSGDSLDLGWAPAMLERACELAGVGPTELAALRRATEGRPTTEVQFLAQPPYLLGQFGPPPAVLPPPEVGRIAHALERIDLSTVLSALPADESAAAALIGHGAEGLVHGVRRYLRTHFSALRSFYLGAASRDLHVVTWWD